MPKGVTRKMSKKVFWLDFLCALLNVMLPLLVRYGERIVQNSKERLAELVETLPR